MRTSSIAIAFMLDLSTLVRTLLRDGKYMTFPDDDQSDQEPTQDASATNTQVISVVDQIVARFLLNIERSGAFDEEVVQNIKVLANSNGLTRLESLGNAVQVSESDER